MPGSSKNCLDQDLFKSLLDDYELTKPNFENAIATGLKKKEICVLFGISYSELEKWVFDNYKGLQLDFVYSRLRQIALTKYKNVLQILAARGNNAAMATINQFVYDMAEEDKIQKIQIVSNVPSLDNPKED